MEVMKRSPKEPTMADIENSMKMLPKSYITEMAKLTERFLDFQVKYPTAKINVEIFKRFLKEDKEFNRQMDKARKSGIKLPTWAYPKYVIDANPDVFLKPKKKSLAATPRKMR